MSIIETLAPDPSLEREIRQASGNLIDIATFNPEGLQQLAQTCNQLYDMAQCVAFSMSLSLCFDPQGSGGAGCAEYVGYDYRCCSVRWVAPSDARAFPWWRPPEQRDEESVLQSTLLGPRIAV